MARPRKKGMDWFPFECEMNKEFKALEELHENNGFVWLVKFWQLAYQTENGEVDLSGIHGVIAAKMARISTDKQSEIIRDCLQIGLLLQNDNGTYTSEGIKKRHIKVCNKREKDRNLIKNELSQRKQCDNVAISTQSRVEKRRVDIEKSIIIPECLNIPNFISSWENWKLHRKQIKKPLTDKSSEMLLKRFELVGVDTAIKMINQSIENGWQGIFEIKPNGQHIKPKLEFEKVAPDKYANVKKEVYNVDL